MSEEPVSKSMTRVWPPTLTGERNSASLWLGVADTSPLSELEPEPLEVAKSRGASDVGMLSEGATSLP